MAANEVILGVTSLTAVVFDEEFPDLKKVSIEPYNISYSKKIPLSLKLLLEAPRIFGVIKKEREQLKKIIHDYQVNVVISDNRFGLYNSRAKCIYITHQLNIEAGIFSALANSIHSRFMKRFQEIWVPDFENEKETLAGKLSRNTVFKNVQYIGPLSRLSIAETTNKKFDYLCLLSGPEPQRTLLENMLISAAEKSVLNIVLVRGTNQPSDLAMPKNLKIYNTPSAKELSFLITSSKTIVCRSGYSTLMDLYVLKNTNCVLIPTPGQGEQFYLANYWKEKFGARVILQKDIVDFQFK